jgi:predicted ATP-grasp superfamily ATP-dependent carboligase
MADLTSNRQPVIGAVIVGGEHPGLGIARSLGRREIPIVIVDDQWGIAAVSRYATRFVRVSNLKDERETVQTLVDVGRRFNLANWVLFPTRDETVAASSKHRHELAEVYKVPTADWSSVELAWDKRKTYALAARLDIPCPMTFAAATESELVALTPFLPLAIKPAIKERFFYATGAKAWRVDTPPELLNAYRRARRIIEPEQILIQEIIPGGGDRQFSYCAFFRNREAHSVLLARRLRQHPHEFGRAATYVETVESSVIEELAERFLKAIDFYGLVEIEFKQDPRDGRYKLLDVNARTWGFHTIGFAAGVDFPYLLFADQIGKEQARRRGVAGKGWLRLVTDAPTAVYAMLRRELSTRAYVDSLMKTRVESVFDLRDPLPSLAELIMLPMMIRKSFVYQGAENSILKIFL